MNLEAAIVIALGESVCVVFASILAYLGGHPF
jgi:hypothetical protein